MAQRGRRVLRKADPAAGQKKGRSPPGGIGAAFSVGCFREASAVWIAARLASIDLGQNKNRPFGQKLGMGRSGPRVLVSLLNPALDEFPPRLPSEGADRVQPRDRRAGPDPLALN